MSDVETALAEVGWDEAASISDENLDPVEKEPGTKLSARSETVGFPSTLPIELALKVAPEDQILEAYGMQRFEYEMLLENTAFIAAYKNALEMVQQEGASFRLKALLQAEELLATSWGMIHESDTPASVRADLIKSTVRWAGLEPKKNAGDDGSGAAQGLQININLDGSGQARVVNGSDS